MEKKSFIRQVFDIGIGTIITLILGIITTPIITRWVEPGVYGSFALFNTYGTLCLTFLGLGLDQTYLRFFFTGKTTNERIVLLKRCLSIVMCVYGAFLCAVWVMQFGNIIKVDRETLFLFSCYVPP